jgi:hypothetical protein
LLNQDDIILQGNSQKGIDLAEKSLDARRTDDGILIKYMENRQQETVEKLRSATDGLPDYKTTGQR